MSYFFASSFFAKKDGNLEQAGTLDGEGAWMWLLWSRERGGCAGLTGVYLNPLSMI